MKCSGQCCKECELQRLEKLCELALKNRDMQFTDLITRLKREILEYERK